MMNHQYGYHRHHNHGGPHVYGGQIAYDGPPMYPTRAVYMGSLGANRTMSKTVVAIGTVLLTVSVILLMCGGLNFAGVIAGENFSVGIPLLGFGGVMLLAGLGFTTVGCTGMRASPIIQEQVQNSMPYGTIPASSGSGYAPHGSGYSQPGSGYPSHGSIYPPPGAVYPPSGSGCPPPGSAYRPSGSSYRPSESPPPAYAYSDAHPFPVPSAPNVEEHVDDSTSYADSSK